MTECHTRSEASILYPPIDLSEAVWAMRFDLSGHHLLTGCRDRQSRIYEVATGQLVAPPLRHQGNVTNLALSADGKRLMTA